MRLLRLKITDPQGFRALQSGFEISFFNQGTGDSSEFNPYILTGANGSGKSNVLEALSSIFYHLECVYHNNRPRNFEYDEIDNPSGFKEEFSAPDAFELEYLIPSPPFTKEKSGQTTLHIKIEKEVYRSPAVRCIDLVNSVESVLDRTQIQEILPKYIIGYSSGENEILSLPFFKLRFLQFDEYKERLQNLFDYTVPEVRLQFLDNEFSQAIFLCNFLMQDDTALNIFDEELGIYGIQCFRIIIKKVIDIQPGSLEYPESLIIERQNDDGSKRASIELTQFLNSTIDILRKCSTTSFEDVESGTLYLDYWVNDATREAFRLHFGSAIELFNSLQLLLTLNLYSVNDALKKELYESSSLYLNETVPTLPSDQRIMRFKDFVLKKRGITHTVYGKSLSDGEFQFLHNLGLALLFRDQNCLILLDEPETHFNPHWKAKFTSRLRGSFSQGESGDTMREVLITTHSPFLISDCRPEYVLMFNKDIHTNLVSITRPDFNTLGSSVNKINMEIFGKTKTIGTYAEQTLHNLKMQVKDGADIQDIVQQTNNLLGDSVEKILFIYALLNNERENS